MECQECKEKMQRETELNSGNAKYTVYACAKCGKKETVCNGIDIVYNSKV